VDHQDEMTSPGGGTLIIGAGTVTLGAGTVSSGGGTPDTGSGTPFQLNLPTVHNHRHQSTGQ